MRKQYLITKNNIIFLLIILISPLIFSQCPTTDRVTFESNQDIADFIATYPNCTNLSADLRIRSEGITDISGLAQLESIGSRLEISQTGLVNLQGLNNIQNTNLQIQISTNESLQSLSGLENIIALEHLYFAGNNAITSFAGLENVQTISNGVLITLNASLENINALSNAQIVGGSIEVSYNESLINLRGLEGATSLFQLYIGRNETLESLEGIDNVEIVDWALVCSENPLLTDMSSLSNVTSVGEAWSGSGGSGGLEISGSPFIENLNSLESLVNLKGVLIIRNNDNLNDISGIDNIAYEEISRITITNNPLVEICNFNPVCDFLADSENDGFATIELNAPGCNSINEVENACLLTAEENLLQGVVLYPNPTSHFLYITERTLADVEIYDIAGKLVVTSAIVDSKIDVSALKSGVYFISIESNGLRSHKKFIKE